MRTASSGKEDAVYVEKMIFDTASREDFIEVVWGLLCLYKQIIATPYIGTGIPSRRQQDVTRAISATVRHYDAVRPTRHVTAAGGGVMVFVCRVCTQLISCHRYHLLCSVLVSVFVDMGSMNSSSENSIME